MPRVHRHLTRASAAVLIVLGLAMLASTLARGGGPLSLGVLLGIGFTLLGVVRLAGAREKPARG